MLVSFEIGKTLPLTHNGQEGVSFLYTESGPLLIIAFDRPNPKEIASIQTGDIQMALYTTESIIFVLSKFDALHWIDAPYYVRLHDNLTLNWSEQIAEDHGIGLQIILIDAGSKIIKAQRYIGCSTKFSLELRNEIEKQYASTMTREEYLKKVNGIYSRLSTDDMVRRSTSLFKIRRKD